MQSELLSVKLTYKHSHQPRYKNIIEKKSRKTISNKINSRVKAKPSLCGAFHLSGKGQSKFPILFWDTGGLQSTGWTGLPPYPGELSFTYSLTFLSQVAERGPIPQCFITKALLTAMLVSSQKTACISEPAETSPGPPDTRGKYTCPATLIISFPSEITTKRIQKAFQKHWAIFLLVFYFSFLK